jgi:hypothetical protein
VRAADGRALVGSFVIEVTAQSLRSLPFERKSGSSTLPSQGSPLVAVPLGISLGKELGCCDAVGARLAKELGCGNSVEASVGEALGKELGCCDAVGASLGKELGCGNSVGASVGEALGSSHQNGGRSTST